MALTTDFVAAVRRQGSIPSSVTSADILALGDQEIQGRFIPLLEGIRQSYFVRQLDAVPDTRGRVPLPARAVGAALRSVQLSVGNGWFPLPLRDLADVDYVSPGAYPDAYAVDGGSIILLPNGRSGTLRIRYAARPGKMVLDTDAASTSALTLVNAPVGTTFTVAGTIPGVVDIISSGPAHQQKAISATQPFLNTFNVADMIEWPVVGDYVALAGLTPFVPLPEELFAALVHSVAANILLAKAYLEEAAAQEKKAEKATAQALLFLKPRNEGNPQVVKGGLRAALSGTVRRGRW